MINMNLKNKFSLYIYIKKLMFNSLKNVRELSWESKRKHSGRTDLAENEYNPYRWTCQKKIILYVYLQKNNGNVVQ